MSKYKFLAISVAFAITYIACDLFFVFYIAGKTDAPITPAQSNTSYQPNFKTQQRAYAFNNHVELKAKQANANKTTTIIE